MHGLTNLKLHLVGYLYWVKFIQFKHKNLFINFYSSYKIKYMFRLEMLPSSGWLVKDIVNIHSCVDLSNKPDNGWF